MLRILLPRRGKKDRGVFFPLRGRSAKRGGGQ
jgi:hypothetical protein